MVPVNLNCLLGKVVKLLSRPKVEAKFRVVARSMVKPRVVTCCSMTVA